MITGDELPTKGLEEEGGDQDNQNTPLLSPRSSGRDD